MENLLLAKNQVKLDIEIIQGDNQEIVLAFNDDAGDPIILSAYTIRLQLKAYDRINASVYYEKSIGEGLSIDGNLLTISFGSEILSAKLSEYYYDILFIKDSVSKRLVSGKVIVINSVTL